MTSAGSAIEAAAYAALVAGVTLATVYQHVPQDTPPPVVIVGDIELDGYGGKDDDEDRQGTLTILSLHEGEARKPLLAIQGEVEDAFRNLSVLIDGWRIGVRYSSSTATLSETGEQYLGLSRFAVIALRD